MAKAPKPAPATGQPTSADILAALPSGDLSALGIAAAGTQRRRLGAPEEVAARNPNLPPDFVPWLDGDEYEPEWLSPDTQARLRAQMAASGLYGTGGATPGPWSREDAEAMSRVLEYANGAGIDDIATATREYARLASTAGITAKKPREGLIHRLTNPESVRQVVRKTALDLTGRRLSDEEEARIVAGFTAMEQRANTATATANEAAGGGTVVEPMSAAEFATSQLEDTPDAGMRRYMGGIDQMIQTMSGTMTEAPRTTEIGGAVA